MSILNMILEKIKWLSRSSMLRSVLILTAIAIVGAICLAAVNIAADEPIRQNGQKAADDLLRGLGDYAEAIEVTANGFSGEIDMLVGIAETGEVTGVVIVRMNETKGLGSRVGSDSFLSRFVGKHAGVTIGKGDNGVEAVTGATVSSKAVAQGVNHALNSFAEKTAGGAE